MSYTAANGAAKFAMVISTPTQIGDLFGHLARRKPGFERSAIFLLRGGQCAAIFWPDKVGPCKVGRHYAYHWDGRAIRDVLELKSLSLE